MRTKLTILHLHVLSELRSPSDSLCPIILLFSHLKRLSCFHLVNNLMRRQDECDYSIKLMFCFKYRKLLFFYPYLQNKTSTHLVKMPMNILPYNVLQIYEFLPGFLNLLIQPRHFYTQLQ